MAEILTVDENADLESVKSGLGELIAACSKWLIDNFDAPHWQDFYVGDWDRKFARYLMNNGHVHYLVDDSGRHVAMVHITDKQPFYYRKYLADYPQLKEPALYVSTLAVHPDAMGQGLGGSLMDFAENLAQERGVPVRLDTRNNIPQIVRFYAKRGYQQFGIYTDQEGDDTIEYGFYELAFEEA